LPFLRVACYKPGMTTLTITAKGQVTFRKDVLEHLGVAPGEKVDVEKLPSGRIEVRAARGTGQISDLFDVFKRKRGPRLGIGEMNAAIARAWAGET
jgi:antitoxin PrlF